MLKTRFSRRVLLGSPVLGWLRVLMLVSVLIFGLFGAWHSHSAHTTRAKTMPAANGISSLPPEAQAGISAALGRDLPAYQVRAMGTEAKTADLGRRSALPGTEGVEARNARKKLAAGFTAQGLAGADPAGSAIFAIRNARNKLAADFTPQGVTVHSGSARWKMALAGYGYGNDLKAVAASVPIANANRVEYRRGELTEWYVNGPMGLEQGFTITRPPQSEKRTQNSSTLTLALTLSGDLTANADRGGKDVGAGLKPAPTTGNLTAKMDTNGKSLTLSGSSPSASPNASPGPSLRYTGLTATDANGKELPASLELRGQELLLKVNDAGARYPVTVDPFVQLAELTASDGANFDELGYSTAISGNTVVAGAGGNSSDTGGIVYVFVKPETGWANMTQTAELTASDGVAGNELGYSVAISGNTVVAGAPRTTVGSNLQQGAAYVFVEPTSGWVNMTETAKLIASDGAEDDNFGTSVAMTTGTVVVGTPQEYTGPGAAYVFVQPLAGWQTTSRFKAKLTASDGIGGAELGASVGISGGTIVAGAPRKPAAYVFVKPTSGWTSMTQTAELTAPLQRSGDLGFSVAISGGTVVAGSPTAAPTGKDSGAADVFVEPSTGWVNMSPTAVLTASDARPDNQLGGSVAISGRTVVAGTPGAAIGRNLDQGAAYVFLEPASGWVNMTQRAKLTALDGQGEDQLGTSVGVSGSTVVAGAINAGGNGAAYVFGETP